MPLDAIFLTALTAELNETLPGARIDRIQQPERDAVVLSLRTPASGNRKLLLSASSNHPRLHYTEEKYENPAQPPMFCMLLRKHLSGGRILSLTQLPMERAVDLCVESADELGELSRKHIWLELMGRNSNLILTGPDGRIIDCLRRVDFEMSEKRQVLPGLFYRTPPAQGRLDPRAETLPELYEALGRVTLSTALDRWAPDSGLFPFSYTYKEPGTFSGKPVESTFSHGGRYLWVPYYRRSYDINAQDPSAVAVIDTQCDSIVRLFETGPLPKMIATSPDGTRIAIAHWGDNTVGLLDIAGEDVAAWHYIGCYTVDYKLKLNYSRTTPVNRDVGSGYCLRGTVFTPDGRYLLVGCMGGTGGIAVIDLVQERYLGRILGMMSNLRHLLLHGDYLYASINSKGYVQRIPLRRIYDAISDLQPDKKTTVLDGWESCKVPAGARTIVISPDGRFVFAACNFSSKIAVVDTRTMKLVGTLDADSYPVGLDISQDGRYLFSTSQARDAGGNAVDIFRIDYK